MIMVMMIDGVGDISNDVDKSRHECASDDGDYILSADK